MQGECEYADGVSGHARPPQVNTVSLFSQHLFHRGLEEVEVSLVVESSRTVSVVLVDDDPHSGAGNKRRLEQDGYHVTLAPDATAAINLIKQASPAVIFLHLGPSSTAFMQTLKTDTASRHIPIRILESDQAPKMAGRAPGSSLRAVARERW